MLHTTWSPAHPVSPLVKVRARWNVTIKYIPSFHAQASGFGVGTTLFPKRNHISAVLASRTNY